MRGKGITRFYVHTVTVEKYLGTNGYGVDMFDTPVVLAPPNGCFVEGISRLVLNKDGIEVTAPSTVYTAIANAPLFNTDARVTIKGIASRVIRVNVNDAPGVGLPEHVAANLT